MRDHFFINFQISTIFTLFVLFISCESNNEENSSKDNLSGTTEDSSRFMYIDKAQSIATWVIHDSSGILDGIIRVSSGYLTPIEGKTLSGSFTLDLASLKLNSKINKENLIKREEQVIDNYFNMTVSDFINFKIAKIQPSDSLGKSFGSIDSTFYLSNWNSLMGVELSFNGHTNSYLVPSLLFQTDSSFLLESKLSIHESDYAIKNIVNETVRLGFRIEGSRKPSLTSINRNNSPVNIQ